MCFSFTTTIFCIHSSDSYILISKTKESTYMDKSSFQIITSFYLKLKRKVFMAIRNTWSLDLIYLLCVKTHFKKQNYYCNYANQMFNFAYSIYPFPSSFSSRALTFVLLVLLLWEKVCYSGSTYLIFTSNIVVVVILVRYFLQSDLAIIIGVLSC